MKKENNIYIYVDETGEFAHGKGSAKFYGVSLVFIDSKVKIDKQLKNLNLKLKNIRFDKMIHIGDLIMKRNEYENMSISERKEIFNMLLTFLSSCDIKIVSFIVDKKYKDDNTKLYNELYSQINNFFIINHDFFEKLDNIFLYYDDGQKQIKIIFDKVFETFNNFKHINNFNKVEERLFQAADLVTFLDKYFYKIEKNINLTNGEKYFINKRERKNIYKIRRKKDFKPSKK